MDGTTLAKRAQLQGCASIFTGRDGSAASIEEGDTVPPTPTEEPATGLRSCESGSSVGATPPWDNPRSPRARDIAEQPIPHVHARQVGAVGAALSAFRTAT